MKLTRPVLVPAAAAGVTALIALAPSLRGRPACHAKRSAPAAGQLIVPGHRAGPVRLGESLASLRRMLLATPPPRVRRYYLLRGVGTGLYRPAPSWNASCGRRFDQVIPWPPPGEPIPSPVGSGLVTAFIAPSGAFLISSGAAVYHTVGGLAPGSTPSQVERQWPNLRAYEDNATSMALNNRPVVYWVSQSKGIAFAFVSNGPRMGWTRSLYTIDVFRPGWKFRPRGCAPPGEWSPLPTGTIHLLHTKPSTTVAQALHVALSEPQGPVHLDLPEDVALAEATEPPPVFAAGAPLPAPRNGAIAAARKILARAKRPVAVLGADARRGERNSPAVHMEHRRTQQKRVAR